MRFWKSIVVWLALLAVPRELGAAEKRAPLMRDFIGINGHTVAFKPELYAPVAQKVRDYHPVGWDLGDDTSALTKFPFARNGVDWSHVYGSWVRAGQEVNACLMFEEIAFDAWKDPVRDARAYGEAFAKSLGPSSTGLVRSAEIGNEPGLFSDEEYRRIFEAMASGLRAGDPKLRIATCAVFTGESKRYFKSVETVRGLEALYDIVNFHLYAEVEGWPTWRRSYPEDPRIAFRKDLRTMVKWRDEHVPEKELWLTEFGWDASTKPAPETGTFAKWEGSTETQQAQWIVRAWLVCAAERIDRAYLFFFNDDDQPQVHGSSGLTRKFEPKPSFHAAAWLQRSLGNYRFSRILREDDRDSYIYEFVDGDDPDERVLAVWKPAGADLITTVPLRHANLQRAEQMPLAASPAASVEVTPAGEDSLRLMAGESPVFLWASEKKAR